MTYTVYIDVVFFVNAVMDFVVLAILNRILDSGAGWGRLLSGAAVGGLWACLVSILPGMPVWLRGMGTYLGVSGLRIEARQKLNAQKPRNIGQASRIPGVSPADIAVLIVWRKAREVQ